GKHDAISAADDLRVSGDDDLGTIGQRAGNALKGIGGRAQIARAIIDNGDRTHGRFSRTARRARSSLAAKEWPMAVWPRRLSARRTAPGAAKPNAKASSR